jgi:hypothetical protein
LKMAEITLTIEDKYIDQVIIALIRSGYEPYLPMWEKDRICVKVPDSEIVLLKRED